MPKHGKQTLSEEFPELAAEWHPTLNGGLTPGDVASRSGKKAWWKCHKGPDHEWLAVIGNRTTLGRGCPICADRKVVDSNCLATLNPKLALEWHPVKNGDLTPRDVSSKSGKKVWWTCQKGDDHEWMATVAHRANGTGCPVCAGQKITTSNCLAAVNPELAAEWHPTLNGSLTPEMVSPVSGKKVWWKCDKGPDHDWVSSVDNRVKGQGCAVCANKKVVNSNCLATTHPDLAAEWHPTKNGSLTPQGIIAGSHKMIWWKCDKGPDHEWKAMMLSRSSQGVGCAVCAGKKVVKSTSLATTHPHLAKEWHPTKNGRLTPSDVSAGSDRVVWWKCDKGPDHEWSVPVGGRQGCPFCSRHRASASNSLATTHPQLAEEWHLTKNGELTAYDVVSGSNKKVWWQCRTNPSHEWRAIPVSRTNLGTGCPYCHLTPQSRQELTITFELMLFFPDIDPRGFKASLKGRLKSIDIFIPQLNLGVEFDGSYWHKDKRAMDKLKTEKLQEAGFEIIRIREEPLKKINDIDIISPLPYNGKLVTDALLSQIQVMFALPEKTKAQIAAYRKKKSLQNESALEAYVDQILSEKADRSK